MSKKIKGSAIMAEDGGFLFTPYNQRPPEDCPWRLVTHFDSGVVRETKNVVQLQITVQKKDHPNSVSQEFFRISNHLIAQMIQKKR